MVTQKQKDALTLTTDRFEVGQEEGIINVEVKANISYEVVIPDEYKDWIAKKSVGRGLTSSSLSFEIVANKDYDKREGEIVIQSGELTEVIKVYQTGGGIILLSESEVPVSDIKSHQYIIIFQELEQPHEDETIVISISGDVIGNDDYLAERIVDFL